MDFYSSNHLVKGIDPVSGFTGTVTSDVVKAQGERVRFIFYKGVGSTGTSTVTVLACSDTSASASAAIPFYYRSCTSGDTWGDWTAATTTGFVTTAGSSQMYEILADPAECAELGYEYIELQMVESVSSAVVGCVLVEVLNTNYQPSGTLIT